MNFLITIWLEIHLKIASKSKVFCPCLNSQDLDNDQPNTNICPVCTWQPGALPQLSQEVVEKSLLLGKALNCRVNNPSSFDRKSYFYPDLPMGYQITQLYQPINIDGKLNYFLENYEEEKSVKITDAHIECDTAKSTHQGGNMLLDFNRAGTPLIEIVTGPDFSSADEAIAFAKEIQRIAKWNSLSDADMEKGQMRVDVNISLRPSEDAPLGTRVELKNINSFSAIKRAIESEYKRQSELIEGKTPIHQETRRRDDLKGLSFSMRSKEDALDYRYFPEPDLPPLMLEQKLLDQVASTELLLPFECIKEMKQRYGFSKEFINTLIADRTTLSFFQEMLAKGFEAKMLAKWISGQISAYMTAKSVSILNLPISKKNLIHFFEIAQKGTIIDNQLKLIMESMLAEGKDPESIIKEKGFDAPALSEEELESKLKEVFEENPQLVDDYKNGKSTVMGFFIGQAMKKTQGKANPQSIWACIKKLLG